MFPLTSSVKPEITVLADVESSLLSDEIRLSSAMCLWCCRKRKHAEQANFMNNGRSTSGFDPSDKRYMTCCCHVKTFTILFGIFEIFTLCFILVAVLPDVSTRVCDGGDNSTLIETNSSLLDDIHEMMHNYDQAYDRYSVMAAETACSLNVLWLVWAITQIVAINLMFFGIKNVRWAFFIPHIVYRIFCCGLIALIVVVLILLLTQAPPSEHSCLIVAASLLALLLLTLIGVLMDVSELIHKFQSVQFRCLHFVKRSQETGFSLSMTRPIGPATISLSDNQPPPPATQPQTAQAIGLSRPITASVNTNVAARSRLPPLRNAYGNRQPRYVADDKDSAT